MPLADLTEEESVRSFVLAGGLRVVGCSEPMLDIHFLAEFLELTLEM